MCAFGILQRPSKRGAFADRSTKGLDLKLILVQRREAFEHAFNHQAGEAGLLALAVRLGVVLDVPVGALAEADAADALTGAQGGARRFVGVPGNWQT